jgi:hypothetical protein
MSLKTMPTLPIVSCVEEIAVPRGANSNRRIATIRCYVYGVPFKHRRHVVLSPDQELAAQAVTLLMELDRELKYARADWNQDRFRRLMRLRPKAVARLRRRWGKMSPPPSIPLGSLRRAYHTNLARHLYEPKP